MLLGLILLAVSACTKNQDSITKATDYNKYLDIIGNKSIDFAHNEIDFWQKKYEKSPNQISYLSQMAANYSTLFDYTANIDNLYQSEQLLTKSNATYGYSNVSTIRALARNYISQHRFNEALVLANKALFIGEGKNQTQKLLFDIQMELGNYTQAAANLNAIRDIKDFDFLIRLAKWNDHKGDLNTAIRLMESARTLAEAADNKTLKIWSYSNLGDYYGHAGRIQDSYDSYLKTLAIDPNYSYALKGIAWIVFSHERNATEAKRIVAAVSSKHNSPDFYLLKAEIAQFEGDSLAVIRNKSAYFSMLTKKNYGVMYNAYNATIYANDQLTAYKALEIATMEVANRPTPASYDLLAWSFLNLGQNEKALEIAQEHVIGKTAEPKANYHIALIYKANNLSTKAAPIKEDLQSSIYELGPNLEKEIKKI